MMKSIPLTCNKYDISRYAEHYQVPIDTWHEVKGRDGLMIVKLNDNHFTPEFDREFNRDMTGVCEPHITAYRKAFEVAMNNFVTHLQGLE